MSSATAPTGLIRGALRLTDYWAILYRRTWKGTVISSFLVPVLYVLAMGVLLGGFVRSDPAELEGASSYLVFIAPGLVAAQTMALVVGEVTYPVMSMIKWERVYDGLLATPLTVAQVVLSHLMFLTFRVATTSAVFLGVLVAFGVYTTVTAVVGTFLVQLLLGLAFATPVYALSATLDDDAGFSLVFRLGMIPMFLFSGAFFPVSNLTPVLEWLAKATPLWQGVNLSRMITLGTVEVGLAVVNIAYLVLLAVAGWVLVVRLLQRRLLS